MKNVFKINGNEDSNISYQKRKNETDRKYYNLPSIEIVMKKEIKDYEKSKENPKFIRKTFKGQIDNFPKYSNTPNFYFTTTHKKSKNFKLFKLDKTSLPFKKMKIPSKFIKINNYINKVHIERKPINKSRILKKNSSQSPNHENLLDSGSVNALYNYNFNKSHLTNVSLNINDDKKHNLKNLNIRNITQENEKCIEDYLGKKKQYKNDLIKSDNYLFNKSINTDRNLNVHSKSNYLFNISQNLNDEFSLNKNIYYNLFSNSEINNLNNIRLLSSDLNKELICNKKKMNKIDRKKSAKNEFLRENIFDSNSSSIRDEKKNFNNKIKIINNKNKHKHIIEITQDSSSNIDYKKK